MSHIYIINLGLVSSVDSLITNFFPSYRSFTLSCTVLLSLFLSCLYLRYFRISRICVPLCSHAYSISLLGSLKIDHISSIFLTLRLSHFNSLMFLSIFPTPSCLFHISACHFFTLSLPFYLFSFSPSFNFF